MTVVLQQPTQSAPYWTSLRVGKADVEHLFARLLEEERPFTTRELALALIDFRLRQEEDKLRKQIARSEVFQPRNLYKVGQELLFPALEFATGKVTGARAGQNSAYGEFSVIEVEFAGGRRAEFASGLDVPHVLNFEAEGGKVQINLPRHDPEEIYARFGAEIEESLEARLVDEEDAISVGGQWYLNSLLAPVTIAHLHLAEAILDMNEGGPLATEAFLNDLGFAPNLALPARTFALNVGLSQDERFDNVGPTGSVQWYLRRLEPLEVVEIPPRLQYDRLPYDAAALSDELRALEAELADEWSPRAAAVTPRDETTVTLIYPHRRIGTLPLNAEVEAMLPRGDDSARLRITLVDSQSGAEFAGWVMPEGKYIFGLGDYYRQHRLPIGVYLTVRRTDQPGKLLLEFNGHRPRTEYIRLAVPTGGRLKFDNFKRSIGAVYDELLILGAEDIDGVDDVWSQTRSRRRTLADIMADMVPELGRLNPQNAVHAKTLYSAVNVVRRCPPGPIFAALVGRPEFEHVGGPYWRLSTEKTS
jgi:hypothetical protein